MQKFCITWNYSLLRMMVRWCIDEKKIPESWWHQQEHAVETLSSPEETNVSTLEETNRFFDKRTA
jgi:poly(3-hydroxyalkanoate) synthetase